MKRTELLKKIKQQAKQDAQNLKDPRFTRTMGLLKAKGLLDTNLELPALPNAKLDLNDVLWAGEHVEPRILEVLPAALLRLERHFYNHPALPEALQLIIDKIKAGEKRGPNFKGIEYKKMLMWINLPFQDRRHKAISEKRIRKDFRLHPETIKKLKEVVARGDYADMTAAVEAAVSKLG